MAVELQSRRIADQLDFGPIDVLVVGVLAAGPTQRAGSSYAVASVVGNKLQKIYTSLYCQSNFINLLL